MSDLPTDVCYHDQLGWLDGEGLDVLAEHWPYGKIWPGDISAKDDKALLNRQIAASRFDSYGSYQESFPAKNRFDKLFRGNPANYRCWVCQVHRVEDDLARELREPNFGLVTHHLRYKRLGDEAPYDLLKLCDKHHREVHRLEAKSDGVQCLCWYVAFLRRNVGIERANQPVFTEHEYEPLPAEFVEQQSRLHSRK